MNHVERFRAVMNFQPVDRLPRWEWAMWWDETILRWHGEGLPRELKFSQVFEIAQHFGLDPYQQFWFSTTDSVGFGLVCVLAGYFLSDFVFKIWLGDVVYDKSSAFIKIFLLYESFLMLNIIPFHFLNGSGNERLNTSLELLSKFLNVMMMVLFFNWMGSIGLVWGLVVSMVIAVPIQAGVLYEKVLPGKRWYQGLSVFLPSIAILGLLFTDNIYVNSVLVVTAAYLFRQIYMNHAEVKKFKVLFQRSVS